MYDPARVGREPLAGRSGRAKLDGDLVLFVKSRRQAVVAGHSSGNSSSRALPAHPSDRHATCRLMIAFHKSCDSHRTL